MSRIRSAVVIGAGLGGIATALRLAHTGWQVTVIERHNTPGGKMNRWQSNGYTFDTGPSLITLPDVFAELFHKAGTSFEEHIQLVRLDPVASYIFPDGSRYTSGQSLPLMQEQFRRNFPGDQSGYHNLLALGGRLFELSSKTFFSQAPGEPPRLGMLSALRSMPVRHGWGGYHNTVRHFISDPRLIRYFDRYATYVGSSPYNAPATLLAIPYLEHAYGSFHIRGGLYQLVLKLVQLLKQAGVDLVLGAHVTGIVTDQGKVRAVQTDQSKDYAADVVVFNGDAERLPDLLGHAQVDISINRSMSGFVMLVGVNRRLEDLLHHNVYFSEDYHQEFGQLFGANEREPSFPEDPTVYVNIASKSDGSLAPEGCETLFIMANSPALDNWTDVDTQLARARVFRRLKSSGFPDLAPDISVEKIFSPADFAEVYDMPGGAIYGQVSHGWRRTFMRPANRYRSIKGLYRVGGSSHPGGGTPTVLMGAKIVEELINRYESA